MGLGIEGCREEMAESHCSDVPWPLAHADPILQLLTSVCVKGRPRVTPTDHFYLQCFYLCVTNMAISDVSLTPYSGLSGFTEVVPQPDETVCS